MDKKSKIEEKEVLEALIKIMPKSLKKKILELVKPDSGIEIVKQFVDQYEDDNMMDHMLAHLTSNLIRKITSVSIELSKDRKNTEGNGDLNSVDIARIAADCLKDELEGVSKALALYREKCSTNECISKNNH